MLYMLFPSLSHQLIYNWNN